MNACAGVVERDVMANVRRRETGCDDVAARSFGVRIGGAEDREQKTAYARGQHERTGIRITAKLTVVQTRRIKARRRFDCRRERGAKCEMASQTETDRTDRARNDLF